MKRTPRHGSRRQHGTVFGGLLVLSLTTVGCGAPESSSGSQTVAPDSKRVDVSELGDGTTAMGPDGATEAEPRQLSGLGTVIQEGTDIIDFETSSIFAIGDENGLTIYASNLPYEYDEEKTCVQVTELALQGRTLSETRVRLDIASFPWLQEDELAESDDDTDSDDSSSPSQDWVFSNRFADTDDDDEKELYTEADTQVLFSMDSGEQGGFGSIRFIEDLPEPDGTNPVAFAAHMEVISAEDEMFYDIQFGAKIYPALCE